MPSDSGSSSREHRLEAVLAEYLRSIESGRPVDQRSFLERHPDLADDLRSFFANRAAMERIAAPLKLSADDPTLGMPQAAESAARVRYFGDYELLDELGRGGMGVVYKARQSTLNRVVALKMILAGELASSDDVRRFRQEAEAAANLDHPHITPIYETGEHNGQQYFSMKLIDGASLREAWDADDPGKVRTGVRLLAAVARAVHHAHQRGVLHRDLKPGNVLLDRDGTPYVTDFGLARRVEGSSDVTRTGAIVGTPSYMAPEQARAERVLTTAVDVYSLGAMLYELLCGRPPFREASPLDTLLRSLANEPVRPRAVNANADRDLETIALKCLEKDAARRYDSAAALADDLERWLAGVPIAARPVSGWERGRKWAQRNPAVAVLAAGIVIALIGGVAGIAWQWRQAVEQRALAVSRAEENQQRVVHQYVSNGAGALEGERPLEALVWFAEALKLERPEAPFQEPHRRRLGAIGRQIPRLVHVLAHDQHAQAAYSPDGRRIATWAGKQVRLWDAETGKPLTEPLDQPDWVWNVTFSPDSKRIAVAINPANLPDPQYIGHVGILETEDGRAVFPPKQVRRLNGWHVQFTPDSRHIVFSAGARIEARSATDWTESWPAVDHRLGVRWIKVSPDGRRLLAAFGSEEAETAVQLYDISQPGIAPRVLMTASFQEFGIDSPFSPDGRYFVTAESDGTGGRGDGATRVKLWDTDTGEQRAEFQFPRAVRRMLLVGREPTVVAHLNDERLYVCSPLDDEPAVRNWFHPIWSFAVSPEGQRIAAQHRDNLSLVTFNRGLMSGIESDFSIPTRADEIVFSPDGQRLAVSARGPQARQGTVHLIDLNSHERVAMAVGHQFGQLTTAFRPGGAQVLTSDEEGFVRTWDVTTLGSSLLPCAELNDRGVSVLELSPSEEWLAIGQGHHDMAVERGGAEPFGLLRVWKLADGTPVGPEMKLAARVQAVRFGRDERQAAVTLSDGSAVVVDVTTGKRLAELAREASPITLALLDGDDNLILQRTPRRYGYGVDPLAPGRIESRRLVDSSQLSSIEVGEHQLVQIAPRGDRCLVVQPNREAALLDTATGKERILLGRLHGTIRRAEFSRDGRRLVLVFDDEIAEIWDVEQARISARLIRQVEVARFSHRGTELLTGKEGNYRVWDARTGEPLSGTYPVASAVNPPRMEAVPEFGPNAETLLTTAGDRLRSWSLAADPRPPEQIVELAQVMSGHGIDEVGGYAARPESELVATWQRFDTASPISRRLPDPAEVTAWHEREAWQCETKLPSEPFRGAERIPALGLREHTTALLAGRPDPKLSSRRGTAHFNLGDGPGAVRDFTTAIETGLDSDSLVWFRRGRAHRLAGNSEAAADDVARAFEMGLGTQPDPFARWEQSAGVQGLRRRLAKKPDDWPALEMLAEFEWHTHDYAACLASYDRLEAAGRPTYFLTYRRAWCLSEIGRGEEAIAAFTKSLGASEDDPADLEGRACAKAKLGRYAEAAGDFEKARSLYASPYQSLREEALMRLLADDQEGYRRCRDESLKVMRNTYGDNPNRVDATVSADVALTCVLSAEITGDLATAVALARHSVTETIGPASDPTLAAHTLALALIRQKEADEALRILSKLDRRTPASPVSGVLRAFAHHRQGQTDESKKELAAVESELAGSQWISTHNRLLIECLLRELRNSQ